MFTVSMIHAQIGRFSSNNYFFDSLCQSHQGNEPLKRVGRRRVEVSIGALAVAKRGDATVRRNQDIFIF